MSRLLENLNKSLSETKERLKLIEQQGPDAVKSIYPSMNLGHSRAYYDLLKSLPREIERLESRINELKHKDGFNNEGDA